MTRALVVGVAMVGLLAGAIAPATAGGDPFLGAWRSIDSDGSHQSLIVESIGPGMDSHDLRDSRASVCDGEPAKLQGRGKVDETTFHGLMDLRCPNGIHFHNLVLGYVYDSVTDTLTDIGGIVWTRV